MSQKITMSSLKSIVKECLIEILSEGIDFHARENYSPPEKAPMVREERAEKKPEVQREVRRTTMLDTPINELQGNRVLQSGKNAQIFRGAKSNSVMDSIFEDTAKTTLQSFVNEEKGEHDHMRFSEQINGSPDQIFGKEISSKWASLAFSKTGQDK